MKRDSVILSHPLMIVGRDKNSQSPVFSGGEQKDCIMEEIMRFIHIADVHLGVTPDVGMPWSEKRGKDIWNSFHMVLEEARRQQADLLLIAGDLFHRQPLKRELKEVAAGFAAIPDTEIVLIAGNHDYLHPKSYYRTFAWPDNVHFILNKDLTPVHLERIHTTVWGCSFWDKEDDRAVYGKHQRQMDSEFQILLGHGGDDRHHPFRANELTAGYDYAAFGHIHKAAQLIPNRVVMAGPLEPTDCNDFGPHGFWMGELTEAGCRVSFYPIKKCEYIRQELPVTPEMSAYAMVGLAQQELAKRAPYQISHLVLRGYRDADIVLPVQELAQLNRVVRVVDETEPDYPFDQLKQRYDGTLLAQYIETLEAYPDVASGRKALYYGVQAMLNAMGEGQET